MTKAARGAVIQFEIDRKRWNSTAGTTFQQSTFGETAAGRLYAVARTAVTDTLSHGGTFVLVATPDKVTMVQRPDAEEI